MGVSMQKTMLVVATALLICSFAGATQPEPSLQPMNRSATNVAIQQLGGLKIRLIDKPPNQEESHALAY